MIASIGELRCSSVARPYRGRRPLTFSDDPYSLEQLKAPRMNISVVRPLVDALYETQDLSIGQMTNLSRIPRHCTQD